MNPDEERLVQILDRALEQTKAGKLKWLATEDKASTNFFVRLGESQLQVGGEGEGPFSLWLIDAEGKVLGSLLTQGPLVMRFASTKIEPWESRLTELWGRARRQALAIDKAIDDVLDALDN